ncbi:MAG: phage holin [Anaerovoracaceae bacterium]|jgi:phi LC3 family holin
MNWKLRFKNKATLAAIVAAVIALVYQTLGIAGVVPSVSEQTVVNIAGEVINLLVLLGIVVDPTTEGFGDSELAMDYEKPAVKTKVK